jgi:hypothetical protein
MKAKYNYNSKPFRWFVLYISSTPSEHNFFINIIIPFLKKLNKNSIDNIEMDIICIGRKNNATKLIENKIIKIKSKYPYYKEKQILEDLSIEELMENLSNPYQGMMLASHSNGITIGLDKGIIIEVIELIKLCKKIVIKNRKFDYFVCDCCYMGSIESLYQLSDITNYILATPSYHDGKYSFIQCPEIYKYNDNKVIWISKFSNWYLSNSEHYANKLDYPIQWSIYDSEGIKELTNYLIKNNLTKELVFNNKSIIYHDDDNLHNFKKVIDTTIKKKPFLSKKLDKLLLLYFKTFVYYSYNQPKNKPFIECPLSIHKELPSYLDKSLSCKMDYYDVVFCKKV